MRQRASTKLKQKTSMKKSLNNFMTNRNKVELFFSIKMKVFRI